MCQHRSVRCLDSTVHSANAVVRSWFCMWHLTVHHTSTAMRHCDDQDMHKDLSFVHPKQCVVHTGPCISAQKVVMCGRIPAMHCGMCDIRFVECTRSPSFRPVPASVLACFSVQMPSHRQHSLGWSCGANHRRLSPHKLPQQQLQQQHSHCSAEVRGPHLGAQHHCILYGNAVP